MRLRQARTEAVHSEFNLFFVARIAEANGRKSKNPKTANPKPKSHGREQKKPNMPVSRPPKNNIQTKPTPKLFSYAPPVEERGRGKAAAKAVKAKKLHSGSSIARQQRKKSQIPRTYKKLSTIGLVFRLDFWRSGGVGPGRGFP